MEVDKSNRNCYNCGEFGYLARNYRNRTEQNRIGEERRLKYRDNGKEEQNNLNGERDLILFD